MARAAPWHALWDYRKDSALAAERDLRMIELSDLWGPEGMRVLRPELDSDFYTWLMTAQAPATFGELAAKKRGDDATHPMLFGPCEACGEKVPVAWAGFAGSRLPEPICLRCGRSVIREFKRAARK